MTAEEKHAAFQLLSNVQDLLDDGFLRERRIPAFMDDSAFGIEECGSESGNFPSILGDSLQKIAEEALVCRKCRLSSSRRRPVMGEGVPDPLVLVVGDAPTPEDDEKGTPFSGEAGQLLDKMLDAIGLSRSSNCYVTSIVKCKPPQNREPLPDEQEACLPFLERQIALLDPKYVIAAGRVPAQVLLGVKDPISALRGNFGEYRGIPLMPTFHPGALIRDPSLKRPAWEDLKKFKDSVDG